MWPALASRRLPPNPMAIAKSLARLHFRGAAAVAPAGRWLNPQDKPTDLLHRLLHRRPFFPAVPPPLPTGDNLDKLVERIWELGGKRIHLDGILPPPTQPAAEAEETSNTTVLLALEVARSKLRASPRKCVTYAEFLQVCCEAASNAAEGGAIARSLDESGAVIVVGSAVLLQPDQVARAIEGAISAPPLPRSWEEELREMEEKKAEIDQQAAAKVKREMWLGLGLMAAQTAGLMRLTFWELSWDVMEPVCFFITSVYVMAGYGFFMRTAKDPSFDGLFESRFAAKQRRLMTASGFDLERFNELKRAVALSYPAAARRRSLEGMKSLDGCCQCNSRRPLLGAD